VDGTLNYTSYRGLRPDLTFDQGDFYIQLFPGPSAHSQDHRNGAYIETYYKDDRDHNPNPLATVSAFLGSAPQLGIRLTCLCIAVHYQ
jgi:hypothetical protein